MVEHLQDGGIGVRMHLNVLEEKCNVTGSRDLIEEVFLEDPLIQYDAKTRQVWLDNKIYVSLANSAESVRNG